MDTSTWLKYINMARWPAELNVDVAHCRGRVYYVTSKDIPPNQELLTHYGDAYDLPINRKAFDVWEGGRFQYQLGNMGIRMHHSNGDWARTNEPFIYNL